MTGDAWQLVFVDALFLCIAGGWGLWVWSWLKEERKELARCVGELKAQQEQCQRISQRLQKACIALEAKMEREERGDAFQKIDREPQTGEREDRYDEAWKLLGKGQAPGDVARRLQLGVAEVELMARILRHKQRP